MGRYRLDFLASLARQMAFAPVVVREKQLQSAEALLLSIDPARAYPPAYIIFRVTGYRPEQPPSEEQVTGLALQHDLGLLIENVSLTLDDRTADRAEPVLQIDDLVQQFNVTSKTIQRWRRRGLAARRFIFPDGKRRVGFRLGVVEQFFAAHRHALSIAVNCSRIDGTEWEIIRGHTVRLTRDARRPIDEITARIGRRVGRTALAIEAELRKHDAEHPDTPLIAGRPASPSASVIEQVQRLAGDGLPIARIAALLDLPRSTAFRLVLADQMARTIGRRIKFHDDPLYHQDEAECVIDALVAQEPFTRDAVTSPPMRGLTSELASLCAHAVLSPTQERALFLQFNFRKFQAAQARHRLDPSNVRRRDLARIDRLLTRATDVRNHIVRANLRLVVSVAKKHVRPGLALPELVNEGSLTLMRAVESFDTRRGHKFSTYATLALMKGFARTIGQAAGRRPVAGLGAMIDSCADRRECGFERVDRADRVERMLAMLEQDERLAVRQHFGLDDTADLSRSARRLGTEAIEKLRGSVEN